MADQDFNIKVVTTADLSGIAQTEAGLKRLSIDEANRLGRIASERQASLRSALTNVPAGLTGGAIAVEAEAVSRASLLSGINLAKARNEAVTFVRELSSGAPTARTLGALLGTLGPSLIGGALAGLFLKNAIDQVATETEKVTKELDKTGQKVVELGIKWREAAKEASSVEDVQRIGQSALSDIDNIGKRIREVAGEDLTTVQTVLDTIAVGFKNAFTFGGSPTAVGPFKQLQEELLRGLQQNQSQEQMNAAAAVKRGLDDQRERHEDIDRVIKLESEHLKEQQALLRNIDPRQNLQSWVSVEQTVERITKKLAELNAQRQKQVESGQPTTRGGLLGQQEGQLQDLSQTGQLTPAEQNVVFQQGIKTHTEKFDQDIKDRTDAFNKEIEDRNKRFTGGVSTGAPITPGVPLPASVPGVPGQGFPAGADQSTIQMNQNILITLQQILAQFK